MTGISSIQRFDNPMLRYRLDLGEPGIAAPARASQSVARVASHELRNILRFKREAAREAGIVVYQGIKLNLSQRGPFLAAVSGHSEARIIFPGGSESNPNRAQDKPEENPLISEQAEPLKKALEGPANAANDLLSTLSTQSNIAQLQVEKAQLQKALRETETDTLSSKAGQYESPVHLRNHVQPLPDGPDLPLQSSPKEAIQKYRIQQRIQEINQEISNLTFEQQPKEDDESPGASSRVSAKNPSVESFLLDVFV